MLLCIVFMICCTLSFTRSYAEEYCDLNVPGTVEDGESVRGILMAAINSKNDDLPDTSDLEYDCALSKLASEGSYKDGFYGFHFDVTSDFNFDWKDSIEKALKKVDDEQDDKFTTMFGTGLGKIGCAITLNTPRADGKHEFKLSCNYGRTQE
ncbi:hypothetical protein GCK32_009992 [Trichostrongylus colubriformis]|uniref:SCP domain-containing protein n=1 Tax=Trichostrongylus colubriformis TaxID=6319 RepID=A0AAN8J321_TRICO